ncbi:MAG: superoxide dismutase [Candidatus Eisenbacteria bacterium]|uniref:Superoxide dismutase n=1 Tax=Eiseniibacteriota bacterium TaxID=2212470 RepID=A0A849SPG9_UNCEI|nr:superoxide dismutase [Candidatus Eisenbacteria bacterium]
MPFPKLTAKTFASIRELNGISARTMEEHYELYKGYITKTNEIQEKLATVDRASANQIYSDLRSLRTDLSFATGGVKNHDLYFAHLGGKGGQPGGKLMAQIAQDFPSYDAWLADFKASGIAARGWVWLAYDHDWNTLTTVTGDAQNTFPLWNATPILGLDVYEHAYWIDFGRARAKYIEAFFNNLDWDVVAQNLDRALAMQAVTK